MIDDSSVSEIHSTLNNDIPNAGGESMLLGDLMNLTHAERKVKAKRITADDPDYIQIKKMVEKFDKKQKMMNDIKEKINKRKLAKE